ncbi:MAG: fimbrial protein [Archangium sp.]|nr:fimbrial protein [Archangium sp.]
MTPDPSTVAPKKSNTPLIIGVTVAVLVFCCITGGLVAIAIPNYLRFGARSKQSEVKMNLKAAFASEAAFFLDQSAYSTSVEAVGFMPERGNRYLYLLSTEGDVQPRNAPIMPIPGEFTGIGPDTLRLGPVDVEAVERAIPRELWNELGVSGKCPDACSITIVGAGNLDSDDTIDVWSISTKARTLDGQSVPAGVPHCHVDDTKE